MTQSQTFRTRWLHFFRGGDYAILLLLLMPILGVFGVSLFAASIQLVGVGLYLAVVLRCVKAPKLAKGCLWCGFSLWFFGLIFAAWVLVSLLFSA